MKHVELTCPMCDTPNRILETNLHIGEPIRCSGCYEVSALTHEVDPETKERIWRLDYLQEIDD
jgi:hypothetical protein